MNRNYDNKDPFTVSVVIPCYNKAQLIHHTIQSVLQQTRIPEEIIVVDDASDDNSRSIICSFPVQLICHERNYGPAEARNTGWKASTADIVVFIDADTRAHPEMIASLLQEYIDNIHDPSLAGVCGRGIEVCVENIYDEWRAQHGKQDFGLKKRKNVPFPFGLCMSFYRNILNTVGGFDPFFVTNAGEDYDLGYRIRQMGMRIGYTPYAVVYHYHKDFAGTLAKVQYNWYYWGYLARKRLNAHPHTLLLGAIKHLFLDTCSDLFIQRKPALARLSTQIAFIRFKAIWDAMNISVTEGSKYQPGAK